jgi:hypothetical protein
MDTLFLGPLDNLIVHIGKVLNVAYLVAQIFKVPAEHVEGYVAEGVAYVGCGVGGDPAHIYFDFVAFGGDKLRRRSSQGVI